MSRKNIVLTSDTRKRLAKMGVQIKNARLRRNISVEEMANKSGVSETTYYAIEKGKEKVSRKYVVSKKTRNTQGTLITNVLNIKKEMGNLFGLISLT